MISSAVWIAEWFKRIWLGKSNSVEHHNHDKAFLGINRRSDLHRLPVIFEDAGIGAALLREDGSILQVNRVLEELLGYSLNELAGQKIQSLSLADDLDGFNQLFNQSSKLTGSVKQEKSFLHKNRHKVWANVTLAPIRDAQSKNNAYLCQFQDITNSKQAEENLQRNQLLLKGIIEGIPDVVFVKDTQGRYLTINNAGAKLFGKPAEEIIGKYDFELFSSEEIQRANENDNLVMKTKEVIVYELAMTINGITQVMLFTKTPFLNKIGQVIGIVVVAQDITEHQRASENLEHSRSELRALSARLQSIREEERLRIAREIHDELGQVLTGLKLDLVSFTKKLPESRNKVDNEQLTLKSQEIITLINNAILTVRKISTELRPGLLDAVGLTAAIEWQAKEFESRTGIKCKLKLPSENIVLDQNRSIAVFRIFQEILTNVARHSQATDVNVSIEKRETLLFLEARDNGRGIKANEFSNPKSLGLLGMRERALLLGGEVSIRGVQNKGTIVTLRVPLPLVSST